jgi:hypothetical protein
MFSPDDAEKRKGQNRRAAQQTTESNQEMGKQK